MHWIIAIACFVVVSVHAQAVPSEDIETFAAKIEKPLRVARYMEGNCVPVLIPEWNGYETRRCSYTVRDKKTGSVKPGLVVLLNPSARQLSTWIINACKQIRPLESLTGCAQRLFRRVIEQSGGQFPVAGIVYEDIFPKDGEYEAYGFANGVTTILKDIPHRRVGQFSLVELESALIAQPKMTASKDGFARIIGVSRRDYLKVNPTAKVDGLAWLDVVREEHKKAMKGNRNALLEAWLATHPQ